jgi:UDP-N-acetylglucosamine 1-carboxyvinyltransferase
MYRLSANKLVGADLFLDEASVTATENAIMASVLAEGKPLSTTPRPSRTCRISPDAQRMGDGYLARLQHPLHRGGATARRVRLPIGPDYMEVGSFIGLAAVTRGELTIENAGP